MPDLVPVDYDPYADFRPSTNVEDYRNQGLLDKVGQQLQYQVQKLREDPLKFILHGGNSFGNQTPQYASQPNPDNTDPGVNPIPEGTTQQLGNEFDPVMPQGALAKEFAGLPQRAADAAITALGPLGEAGMTVGEAMRTGHLETSDIPAIAGGIMLGVGAPEAEEATAANAVAKGIRAYHGSPYDFDKFDISKIGTGEGAQAYGHGLYFAENPSVAGEYRNALTGGFDKFIGGQAYDSQNPEHLAASLVDTFSKMASPASGIKASASQIARNELEKDIANPNLASERREIYKQAAQVLDSGQPLLPVTKVPRGKTYEVSLNADPEHFLDWDKPLSEQSPKVKQILQAGKWAGPGADETGAEFLRGLSPEDHAQLGKEEIPGIKYLDQGSRNAGDGTRNYVVFSPDIINIIKKYGLAGLVAGGAAHFSTTPVDHNPYGASQ